MECPRCGHINPPEAQWCDCGYHFVNPAVRGYGTPGTSQTFTQQAVPILGVFAGIGLAAAITYLYGFQGRETVEQVLLIILWVLAPMIGAVIGGTLVGLRWLPEGIRERINPAMLVAGLVATIITGVLVGILLSSLDKDSLHTLLNGPFKRPNRLWFLCVVILPVALVWTIITGVLASLIDLFRKKGKPDGIARLSRDERYQKALQDDDCARSFVIPELSRDERYQKALQGLLVVLDEEWVKQHVVTGPSQNAHVQSTINDESRWLAAFESGVRKLTSVGIPREEAERNLWIMFSLLLRGEKGVEKLRVFWDTLIPK
jgi:hypothetical protein